MNKLYNNEISQNELSNYIKTRSDRQIRSKLNKKKFNRIKKNLDLCKINNNKLKQISSIYLDNDDMKNPFTFFFEDPVNKLKIAIPRIILNEIFTYYNYSETIRLNENFYKQILLKKVSTDFYKYVI